MERQSVCIIHANACLVCRGVGQTISSTPFRRAVWFHIIHAKGVEFGSQGFLVGERSAGVGGLKEALDFVT